MRRHATLLFAVAVALSAGAAQAQSKAPSKAWTPPRTPDGHPDLQGVWLNSTITPFERPASLGNKVFLTDADVAAIEQEAAKRRADDPAPPPGQVGTYNQFWMDAGERVVPTRRTALVIDPPDGRVPLRPEAEAAKEANRAREGDSYEFMSVWDRCITRGVPGGMFPAGYNNAYQIIQTPGYITIFYEMIHEARIIPVDGRPHVSTGLRQWNGDSRGHWEGNTLVVETTNFNRRGWIATNAASGRIKGTPQTESLHVVERFTPIDANTVQYHVTLTDPTIFARPWTAEIPLRRDSSYRIYEYACHEGNHAIEGHLRGARAQEAR